jgi:hypothetical protein
MSAGGYTSIGTAQELREADERDWLDEVFGERRHVPGEHERWMSESLSLPQRDEGDYWGRRIAEAYRSIRKGDQHG